MSELVPSTPPPKRLAWEKLDDEPVRLYAQFVHYRNMGPMRSLAKAARDLRKASKTLERHSANWDWQARVIAYDDYLERRFRDERETELLRAERAEAQLGRQMTALGGARLYGRRAGVSANGEPVEEIPAINPADLDALDAAKLVEMGVRIRRLSDGQPTDHLRGMGAISPAEMIRITQGIYEICTMFVEPDRIPRVAAEVKLFIETGRMPYSG